MRTGLTVIAYVTAKAGLQDQVRDALLDLVAQTRNEKGCVNYDVHQSQENASQFAIYENWEKPTDLEAGVGLEVGRFVEHVKQGTRAIESVTLRIAWRSRIAGSNGHDAFLL